jgi:hypothetical protein
MVVPIMLLGTIDEVTIIIVTIIDVGKVIQLSKQYFPLVYS